MQSILLYWSTISTTQVSYLSKATWNRNGKVFIKTNIINYIQISCQKRTCILWNVLANWADFVNLCLFIQRAFIWLYWIRFCWCGHISWPLALIKFVLLLKKYDKVSFGKINHGEITNEDIYIYIRHFLICCHRPQWRKREGSCLGVV